MRRQTYGYLPSRSANRHLLAARVSGSTLTAVGRFQLLARWPGTHSRILSGIPRAAQTVLGVYLKRTCSRVTSASSALGVLNDYALYKSTHSLTHSPPFVCYQWYCLVTEARVCEQLAQGCYLEVDQRGFEPATF